MTDRDIEAIQNHLDRFFQLWEYERTLLEEVKKLRKWIEGIRFSTLTALEYVDKDEYYEFLIGVPEEAAELLGMKGDSGITVQRRPAQVSPSGLGDRPVDLDLNLDSSRES